MARVTILVEDGAEGTSTVSLQIFYDPKPTTIADMTPALVMGAFILEFAEEWIREHSAPSTPAEDASGRN